MMQASPIPPISLLGHWFVARDVNRWLKWSLMSALPVCRCLLVLRSLSVLFQDQAAKEKALQSMATMSSAQIVSPTAFQNKMALQGLSRPAYPTTGGVSL